MVNLRLTYSKTGLIRFTSHLDMMRAFTRAFYRSRLPVYFTEGFNPHPYIILGLPLPLGFESLCDICDFRLSENLPGEEVISRLQNALPEGIQILKLCENPAPLKNIASARYKTVVEGQFCAEQIAAVKELFLKGELITVKKGKRGEKEVDIRPLIREIEIEGNDTALEIDSLVAAGSAENLNPDLFLKLIREKTDCQIDGYLHTRLEILDAAGNPFK